MGRKKRCIDQNAYIPTFSEINYLSLLNVDMLLYLIKFLHPIERFNLVLSGTLGGVKDEFIKLYFANSFRFPIKNLEFGPDPYHISRVKIRSLCFQGNRKDFIGEFDASDLCEHFMKEEIMRNIRLLDVSHCYWIPRCLLRNAICSMKHLEQLNVHGTHLSVFDLSRVFAYCSNITRLSMTLANENKLSHCYAPYNDQLRMGFRRLNCLKLAGLYTSDEFKIIQDILSWCGESTELQFRKFYNWEAALRDHSAYFTSSHSKDSGPEDSESDEYSDDLDDFEEFEEFDDSETESCDSDDEEDSDSDVPKFCEDSKFPGCFVESKDDCDFSFSGKFRSVSHLRAWGKSVGCCHCFPFRAVLDLEDGREMSVKK